VPGLVDTSVLVYRFDPRFPRKQHTATGLLRRGLAEDQAPPGHRRVRGVSPSQAIRGWVAYQLGWFDAHLWACAEEYGLETLLSEDFQHERLYGTVRALNPFI
jgi:predicted nucleic acid-binding protein